MDNTRNKKDRNLVSSVSEGKNMEILSLSLKKRKWQYLHKLKRKILGRKLVVMLTS